MPEQITQDDPIAYPALKRSDIARMVALLLARANDGLDVEPSPLDGQLLAYLLNFHTKRWGLPQSLRDLTGRP